MEVRSLQPNALVINESDNVAVTLEDIRKGETVRLMDGRLIEAAEDIPYSHKVALHDLAPGEDILKYGEIIGQAKEDIKTGDWVHVHNLVVED
jgi:altronate dehydratase